MDRIRFMHIPKTVGTSFTDLLVKHYAGRIFVLNQDDASVIEKFNLLPSSVRKRIGIISGHAERVTGNNEIDSIPTITFLRNPVDRCRSYIQHVSEGKSLHLVKEYPPASFDLDRFLFSEDANLSNIQAKMILGHDIFGKLVRTQSDYEIADIAFSSLKDNFIAFGMSDRVVESLFHFGRVLGWKNMYPIKWMNKGSKKIKLLPHHIDMIKKLNTIDILLYQLASKRFEEALAEHDGKSLAVYLEQYAKINSLMIIREKMNPLEYIQWLYRKL